MGTLRERALQFGLPVLAAAFGVLEVFTYPIRPVGPAAVLELLAPLPLAARYRWPVAAAVTAVGSLVLLAVVGVDLSQPTAPVIVLGLAAYTLGARLPLRKAVLYGVVLMGLVGCSQFVAQGDVTAANPVFGAVLTFGALSMGAVLRSRHTALEAAAAAEREVTLAQERTRIARELHDLIAHTVSVMVVQASAAEQVLRIDPDRAQQAILQVQRAGRDALSETARLLDLLREGPEDASPQPGLAQLPSIVRATPGLAVDLHVEETLPRLPAGAEVSVYRIVQEALMNVLKHSSSGCASVRVAGVGDDVVVRVEDPGPPRRHEALPGGHGLMGMRERVEMYGGRVHAGPSPGRGWRVEATIPAELPA